MPPPPSLAVPEIVNGRPAATVMPESIEVIVDVGGVLSSNAAAVVIPASKVPLGCNPRSASRLTGACRTIAAATVTFAVPPPCAAKSSVAAASDREHRVDRRRADQRRVGVLFMAPKPFAGNECGPPHVVAAATARCELWVTARRWTRGTHATATGAPQPGSRLGLGAIHQKSEENRTLVESIGPRRSAPAAPRHRKVTRQADICTARETNGARQIHFVQPAGASPSGPIAGNPGNPGNFGVPAAGGLQASGRVACRAGNCGRTACGPPRKDDWTYGTGVFMSVVISAWVNARL
jgi:hypothetical protein